MTNGRGTPSDLYGVKADALVRPVAGYAVPAGRSTDPCHPVRIGAGRGGAFLVPPARLLIVPTLGLVWHPVDLATPDHAASRGQPFDATAASARPALPPGRRVGSPQGGRRDATPGHPGDLPARRGRTVAMLCAWQWILA